MTAGMRRFVYSFLAAAALALAPGAASAQATQQTALAFSQNLEVRVDGEKLDNEMFVYIGSSRCTKETMFEFKATGYNANPAINNLEFWASAGTGTDCSQAANRTKTSTTTSPCWFIETVRSVSTTATLTASATDIFKSNADDTSEECPEVSGNSFTVYLVPLDSETQSNPNMPPAPLNVPVRKATFSLNVATPEAPSKIKGSTGESELRVSWTKPSDFKNRSKFYAIFDLGLSTEDSECAETVLKKDDPPLADDGETIVRSSSTTGTKALLKGLDAKGVAIDQYVAATVIHRDQAGNDSNQSEVVCLRRVDVVTPLEECDEDPDCKDDFDSCSLRPGGGQRRGALAALSLLGLALALFARRRHV